MKVNLKLKPLKPVNFNKKKAMRIGIIAAIVVVLSAIVFFLLNTLFGDKLANEKVYVDSVKTLVSLGDVSGTTNRYSGVVEAQDTWNIQKSSDKEISEVFVKEGQTVKKGTKLFSYNVEDTQMSLEETQLEVEKIQNDITSMQNQLTSLQQESSTANADDKLDYSIQISSTQASIKKSEYELRSKSAEVTKLQNTISNAVVESKMKGVVQTINTDTSSSSDDSGSSSDSNVVMSILATGEYRVKGTVSEENVYTIEAGSKVIVRSRTDDKAMWKGTLQAVDTEKPESSSSSDSDSSGSDGTNTGTSSSTYPFYVQLSSSDGLILGQHVYIEPDVGQADEKDGLWLPSYYFVTEGTQRYVWVAGDNDLLEKRSVTVGEYDDSQDTYEIVSGLTEEDYIAFPSNSLQEGMGTTKNANDATVDTGDGDNTVEDASDDTGLEDDELNENDSTDTSNSDASDSTENVDEERMDDEDLTGSSDTSSTDETTDSEDSSSTDETIDSEDSSSTDSSDDGSTTQEIIEEDPDDSGTDNSDINTPDDSE